MKSKSEGKVEHNERKEQKVFQGPTCYHCKKKGHVMSDCWFLKKADSKKGNSKLSGEKGLNGGKRTSRKFWTKRNR